MQSGYPAVSPEAHISLGRTDAVLQHCGTSISNWNMKSYPTLNDLKVEARGAAQGYSILLGIRKSGPLWLPGSSVSQLELHKSSIPSGVASPQCQGPEATETEEQESQAQDQLSQLMGRGYRASKTSGIIEEYRARGPPSAPDLS